MSVYEEACHGWREGEEVIADRHPRIVWLLGLPTLAAGVYMLAALAGRG